MKTFFHVIRFLLGRHAWRVGADAPPLTHVNAPLIKAFRRADGSVHVFRMDRHLQRFQQSARQLVLPEPDAKQVADMVRAVINRCRDAVPEAPNRANAAWLENCPVKAVPVCSAVVARLAWLSPDRRVSDEVTPAAFS